MENKSVYRIARLFNVWVKDVMIDSYGKLYYINFSENKNDAKLLDENQSEALKKSVNPTFIIVEVTQTINEIGIE